ncbi:hypothetical protein C5167_036069 [Papaver somniferum]|uniref:inactive protein RESTRICTED TEV MOVEMENT 2-like n=1 Tax=Papaver somniferum TaxID=3469 RepID=UPI000E705BCB|nr:inactive protein RESTRICTED TEV MOVEMENT 2-like [Papaver somniferum]RZC87525.1 hypothetical protein C5167_036069 [Papaver somniferum]
MEQMKRHRDMGERTNTRLLTYEDFQPSTDWTHDLNCHVLLVDLPGFKKEELKVQVDNSWKITISGERKVSENKYCRFKQISDVPKDSDIDKISGRFDGGLLFVIIPKKKAGEKLEEPKNMNQNVKDIVKEKEKELQKEENQKKKNEKKDEMEKVGLKEDLTAEKSETEDWRKEGEVMKEKGKEVVKHLTENAEEIISKADDGLRKEGEILKEQGKGVVGNITANAKKVIGKHEGWRKEGEDVTEKGKEVMGGFMENAKGTVRKKGGWTKEREVVKEKGKEVVEVVEDFMGNAKEIISNNKVAIATAVIAFSIGVLYISHRLRSGGQ